MKKSLLILSLIVFSGEANAQNVTIPDANFKAYLVGNTSINTNLDTEIQVSEASAFTGEIDCGNMSISDLAGIEMFNNFAVLKCYSNQITELNLINNAVLSTLSCGDNPITSLDVSNNTNLTRLECPFLQLTALNLCNNSSLQMLYCHGNQLTELDLSANTALYQLECDNNLLTSLNLKNGNNANINFLFIQNNTNLACVQVDNATYSTNTWTGTTPYQFDSGVSFNENCGYSSCNTASKNELYTSKKPIQVYPNPTTSTISIQLETPTNLVILSTEGKIVVTLTGNSSYNFDASTLENGVYFIQTENGAVQKFIKN